MMTARRPYSAADREALRACWAFFMPRRDVIDDRARERIRALEQRPVTDFVREPRDHPRVLQVEALVTAALDRGDWEPMLDELRALGARYATAGVSYAAWYELVTTYRDVIRDELRDPLTGATTARLPAAVLVDRGIGLLVDLCVETIAAAFLAQTEQRLRETERQLLQAQKLDAIGRLAGGVAHDFNNVLTVVESYAWMLEESFDAGDLRRGDAAEIRRAAERASGITRQLLALSRHSMASPRVIQLDDCVESCLPMLRKLVGERIAIVVHRGDAPTVTADPVQIEQVLMNLSINARDAMSGTGRLTVETSAVELDAEEAIRAGVVVGHFSVLAVTDTGSGMDADTQRRIFDPFFTTKEVGKGTGLGLAIVQGVVKQAGGAVTVYSVSGRGTTFRILLPVTGAAVTAPTGPLPKVPAELPPITVLVVDDQDDVRRVAAKILQQSGCTVLLAASGVEARKLCVSHDGPIHVALLDVVLTDTRGDLIAVELRELRPSLEIVLMSGYPAGALGPAGTVPPGLLAKPFTPVQLRAAVARVAAEAAGPKRRAEPSMLKRILVADDDPSLRKTLTRYLKKHEYDVIEVESGKQAIAALESTRFDVVVSDVHMPDGDGLDILRAVRRVDLDVPVILISGAPDVETASKALEYGAFRYLTKPLELEAVGKLLRLGVRAHALARLRREAMSVGGSVPGAADRAGVEVRFERALDGLFMMYQPIVHATGGELFGVEALMRSDEPSCATPMAILEAATYLGRMSALSRRVRVLAATALAPRGDIPNLFVNLHPEDLLDVDLIAQDAALTALAPRVILEVTERASLTTTPELNSRIARLRELGFRLAVDDIGAGYSGLTSFADLTPEIVKIDMSLIRDVHLSTLKQRTIAALCNLCHDVGAQVVGEGVETEPEREALRALGCDLLQGFLVAKPSTELPRVR